MRIEETTIADKIEAMAPLLRQHWDETATDKARMVLRPNVQAYAALEAAGLLIGLVAYDDADRPIGYAVTAINPSHLHYADLCAALNDVLYVHPDWRGAREGQPLLDQLLITETERIAKERGVGIVMWHAKPGTPLEALLPRLGYAVQDVIYSRGL